MSYSFERTETGVDNQELRMCAGKQKGNGVPGQTMKACVGGVQLNPFFTSAVDESKWSASWPGRFLPAERAPSTH